MEPAPRRSAARRIILVVMVVTGALSALGIVGYHKVRLESEYKAVMCPTRQLAAAADQYFLENGVSTVAYRDLVGATNYIKAVNTVANETYPLYYTQGHTITVTGVAGARTITYAP